MCKKFVAGVSVIVAFAGVSCVSGQTLGRNYFQAEYENVTVNDLPAGVDDSFGLFGVGCRLAGEKNVDFIADFGVGKWEGLNLLQASIGFQPYFVTENEGLKVFGDIRVVYMRMEDAETDQDEDEGAVSGGLGAELNIEDFVSVAGQLNYVYSDLEDDVVFAGSISKWVGDKTRLEVSATYAIESEEVSVGFGVGYDFL